MPRDDRKRLMRLSADEVTERCGRALVPYVLDELRLNFETAGHGTWPPHSKLTVAINNALGIKSAGLLHFTGMLRDRVTMAPDVVVTPERITIMVGTTSSKTDMLAHIHSFGAWVVQRPTDRMRRFFWALFRKTGETAFRAIALSKVLVSYIPPRPFMYLTDAAANRLRLLFQSWMESMAAGQIPAGLDLGV